MKIALGGTFPPATEADVNAERDRRFDSFFPFMGKLIQNGPGDRENIAGAKSAATDAKLMGAQAGDLAWQKLVDPERGVEQFAWITLDNSLLPLDADQVIAMGYAALAFKQSLIFKARTIKDSIAAGAVVKNVRDDALWL